MKSPFLTPLILILLAAMSPASAQTASDTDYTCWQCPVCGYTVILTPAEAESIDPYTLCPNCYSAYAGNFIQVYCSGYVPEDDQSDEPYQDNEQPYWQEDEMNSQDFGDNKDSEDRSGNGLAPALDTVSNKEKILMVLPPDQYQEEELNVPRDYFQSMGYQVHLASKGVKTATGMSGERTEVDLDLDEVKLSDYIAVVFVGGEGIYSQELNRDPDYQKIAKSASAQKKIVGAICLGPWILADAGLLKGKKATASETDHIKSKGAIVSDDAVVQDGKIITANGPSASQEFAEAVVAALQASSPTDGNSDRLDKTEGKTAASINAASQAAAWRCTVCGYVYDPAENDGVAFEDLPGTWKCPCGAPKSKFVRV